MDDMTVVEEKKYKTMKWIVVVSSVISGAALIPILYILSIYVRVWFRI